MEKFHDEKNCREMLGIKEEKQVDGKVYFIRKELKNHLFNKSKEYVIEKIGNPDEILETGSGTYFKYNRAITRYSLRTPPDKDFTVVFIRGHVSQFFYTSP